MKLNRSGLTVLALTVFCATAAAHGGECSGNGCDYIQIQKRGGCIVILNTHSKPITVKPKATFVSFGLVYANSEFIPKYGLDNQDCLTSYNYDYSAIVSGVTSSGQCAKVRPLKDLGWRSGHKTNFCKGKGYKGVTNFPHSDYRDYDGGFCYSGDKNACLESMKGYPK
jgi:hypothetical protein